MTAPLVPVDAPDAPPIALGVDALDVPAAVPVGVVLARVSALVWETVSACPAVTGVQVADLQYAARAQPRDVDRVRHALRILAVYGRDLPRELVAGWLAELGVPGQAFAGVEQAWAGYRERPGETTRTAVEEALRRAVPDPGPAPGPSGPARPAARRRRALLATAAGDRRAGEPR